MFRKLGGLQNFFYKVEELKKYVLQGVMIEKYDMMV